MCNLDDRKTIFPVVKSEITCASTGLVETTKTSLLCSAAVDQSTVRFAYFCHAFLVNKYPSAVARGGAGGARAPQFFSLKVKTDLYKMLKIKYCQATV